MSGARRPTPTPTPPAPEPVAPRLEPSDRPEIELVSRSGSHAELDPADRPEIDLASRSGSHEDLEPTERADPRDLPRPPPVAPLGRPPGGRDPIGRRFGPYVVDGVIGRGGMGAVYRARHADTGVAYALKVIRPDAMGPIMEDEVARFQREAEVLARLGGHPNIVRVHKTGTDAGTLYTVMELIEGKPLTRDWKGRAMPPEQSARLVATIARAIQHAHELGVIHRDLKPANIVVEPDGTPRVLDFGLALDAQAIHRLTRTGEALGTPSYMAPEQVDPELSGGQIGVSTDVYGLGAILYTLLTGHAPFEGDAYGVLAAVLTDEPRRPSHRVPGLPADIEAICLRAMAKSPDDRYPTAAAMAEDVERFLRGEPVAARVPSRLFAAVRRILPARGRRRRITLGAGAAVLAGVAAVGAVAVGLAWSEAARRRRLAELEAFDAAFTRAAAGDIAAIGSAVALGRPLERSASDEPGLRDRIAVVKTLRQLAEGDEMCLRALELDEPPWRAYRDAVVTVLAASNHPRLLAIVIEKEPRLLEVSTAKALARAIAAGEVERSSRLMKAIADALDENLRQQPDARRRDDYRAVVIELFMRAVLAPDPGGELADARSDWIAWLRDAVRSPGAIPATEPEDITRLIALRRDPAQPFSEETRFALDEIAFTLKAGAKPVAGATEPGIVAELLAQQLGEALVGRGTRSAFNLGAVVNDLGISPMTINQLALTVGREPDREAAERELAREAELRHMGRLGLHLARIIDAEVRALDPKVGVDPVDARTVARGLAFEKSWDLIEPVLAQRRPGSDPANDGVPAWLLSWLAHELGESRLWRPDAAFAARLARPQVVPTPSAEAIARVRAQRPRCRARILPALIGRESDDPEDVLEAVDALHAEARARDLLASPERRHFHVPLRRAMWDSACAAVSDAEVAEARLRRALAALREAAELASRRAGWWKNLETVRLMAGFKAVDHLHDTAHWTGLHFARRAAHDTSVCDDLDRLVAALDEIGLALDDARPHAPLLAAVHHFGHGRVEEGFAEYERALGCIDRRVLPPGPTAQAHASLIAQGEADAAARLFERIAAVDRDLLDPEVLSWRAGLFDALGRAEEAAADRAEIRRRVQEGRR